MIAGPLHERPAAQVREIVRRRPGVERARRGGADVAVLRRLLGDRGHCPRHRRRSRARRAGLRSASRPLRVDAFTVGTTAEIQKVRRTGLTFAPEGGTWRMRTVINKLITEEDLYGAVEAAFSQGWRRVKLYFLIGLPTELDEDVLGIAHLGARCVEIGRQVPEVGDGGRLGGGVRAQAAHTRSSGSARTRWPSSSARWPCSAGRPSAPGA